MVYRRKIRQLRVVVNHKADQDKRSLYEKHFWKFVSAIILISIFIRVFDFSLRPISFKGLFINRPYYGLHSWASANRAWAARNHVKYSLDGRRRRKYPDRIIAMGFTCPAVHAPTDANSVHSPLDETDPLSQHADVWVSDYAMNSNCREGSPDDMVFLFESQPGWNQNGGPELFTFNNHDPKGGCVLLNDGTVKFVRTKEELQKLRWK